MTTSPMLWVLGSSLSIGLKNLTLRPPSHLSSAMVKVHIQSDPRDLEGGSISSTTPITLTSRPDSAMAEEISTNPKGVFDVIMKDI